MSNERILSVGDVDLCIETYGEEGDPALLLIGGMSASMDYWEDEFCERLAAGSRYVVRYDHRDTGRSSTYPPGEPGYTGADLREDAISVLDAVGIERAHLVGISMGAGIAQEIAVTHPGRVASLTLMSTTAALGGMRGDLPPIGAEMADFFAAASRRPEPDWADREAVVARLAEDQHAFMRGDIDEARLRAVVERVVDRSTDIAAMDNHGMLEEGPAPGGTLADITAPTLVVHGTADPMFPLPHGEALAAAIPDATLLPLDGVGHEMPPDRTWDVVVPALLRHTGG